MHTADIGVIEPTGYLRIVDRVKDVIKTGGEWVSSLQLEDLILQCSGVAEAAVIGIKDEKWGERPVALIVRDSHHPDLTEADLRGHLKSSVDSGAIPKFAIPDEIRFVDAIPRTSVGKYDKKLLEETLASGTLAFTA
jgi:fatty-acyl-CoA synthase